MMSSCIKVFFVCLLALCAAGCNIMGAVADKVSGGEKREAMYLLANAPTVVIAENWQNPTATALDAEQVARSVTENLRSHNTTTVIDPTAVMDLRSQRADFHKLSIAQIGKAVGAYQIIYINMTDTALMEAQGSDALHGKSTARVKVIDVATGEVLFPSDAAEGYPIAIRTPMVRAHGEDEEAALRQQLLEATANRISQLFYKAAVEE